MNPEVLKKIIADDDLGLLKVKREKLREARIRGKYIPKGCRKERSLHLSAYAQTDEQAIELLRAQVNDMVSRYQSKEIIGISFSSTLDIYDIEKDDNFITRPIFYDQSNNHVAKSFCETYMLHRVGEGYFFKA